MNNTKIYTAQEMRDIAENITRVDVMDGLTCREHCYPVEKEVKSMLRYAADVVERCEEARLDFHSCPDERDIINYILRGGAGKEEQ